MQPGSTADLRRRFRTGRPCLDLVHTGGEGALAQWEIVNGPDDLGRLLGVMLGLGPLPATEADLAAMRPLRAALTRIAYHRAEGSSPVPIDPPRPDDVTTVNSAAAVPPLVPALRPDGGTTFTAPNATAALSTIARDAVALFGGSVGRIRVCAAENCGLLLVDTSRPGLRRWCSMEVCGNRAKVRSHRSSDDSPGKSTAV
jgi:predicted RNA-binding Zn ribbon-like protein